MLLVEKKNNSKTSLLMSFEVPAFYFDDDFDEV